MGFSAPTRTRRQVQTAKDLADKARAEKASAAKAREQRRKDFWKARPKSATPTVDVIEERVPETVTAAAQAKKPALSEGKMRDYGYGVPGWSPYYVHPNLRDLYKLKVKPTSSAYGDFSAGGAATDPVEQCRAARLAILEQKGRATTDHTWELFGHRHPSLKGDLEWTKLAHKRSSASR